MKSDGREVEFNMKKVTDIVSFLKSVGEIEITPKKIWQIPENVY